MRLDYYLLQLNLCILSLMRRLIKFSVSIHLTRLLDYSLYQFLVKFHSNLLNLSGVLLNNLLIDFVYCFSGIPGIKFACPSRVRLSEVFLIYYYSPTFDTDVLLLCASKLFNLSIGGKFWL